MSIVPSSSAAANGTLLRDTMTDGDTADTLLEEIRMRGLEERHHHRKSSSSSLKGLKMLFKKDAAVGVGVRSGDDDSNKACASFGSSMLCRHKKSGSWDLKMSHRNHRRHNRLSAVLTSSSDVSAGDADSLGNSVRSDDDRSAGARAMDRYMSLSNGGVDVLSSRRKVYRNPSSVSFVWSSPVASEFV